MLICVSPVVVYRMIRHGRYRSGWQEKLFGLVRLRRQSDFSGNLPPTPHPKRVWLHAVSVGEVQLLRTIVESLRSQRPNMQYVISTSTDSGFELANKLFSEHCDVVFAPLDFSWAVRNAFHRISPAAIILVELEIWPNWLLYANESRCPVLIVNGRLSEKSFRGYSKVRSLLKPILDAIQFVASQNDSYSDRFVKLGIPHDRVLTTGSIKFDGAEPDRNVAEVQSRRALLSLATHSSLTSHNSDSQIHTTPGGNLKTGPSHKPSLGTDSPSMPSAPIISADDATTPVNIGDTSKDLQRTDLSPKDTETNIQPIVWVAGSTQDPEESLVLSAYKNLVREFPNLKLILVPRHPERFDSVAQQLEATGLNWNRRSDCQIEPPPPDWQIFLGDSVGELRWWWGLADIAFVGGSFGNRGGQNMIEPCAFGVATCFGPNTKNFRDIVHLLLQENACVQLDSPESLEPWIRSMIADREKRNALGGRAHQVAAKHRGALDRTIGGLLPWLTAK